MRKALVVGINNYPQAPLRGSVNDAEVLGSLIKKNGDGSLNFDVHIHNDVPTKAKLTELIYNLFSKGKHDVSLFYFSGHGTIDDLDAYLVTPDAKKFDPGVSVNNLLKMANDCQSGNRIIILDCCNSGAAGSSNLIGGKTALINSGVTIMTASKADESSIEINGHGVFTNLLIEALKGGAADIRGNISPGSIYAYIDQALGAHDQRPVFKTNVDEFTYLRKIIPLVPQEVLRKLVEYFPDYHEQFDLDPSFEETNSKKEKHFVIEPFAKKKNITIFKNLQQFQSVGLVRPKDAPYMYFAAMKSKSCVLTPLGRHYWRLVKEGRI